MSKDTASNIIFEMAPMKPVRKNSVAANPAPVKAAIAAKPSEPATPAASEAPVQPPAVAQAQTQPSSAAPPAQNTPTPAIAAASNAPAQPQQPVAEGRRQSGVAPPAETTTALEAKPAAAPTELAPPRGAQPNETAAAAPQAPPASADVIDVQPAAPVEQPRIANAPSAENAAPPPAPSVAPPAIAEVPSADAVAAPVAEETTAPAVAPPPAAEAPPPALADAPPVAAEAAPPASAEQPPAVAAAPVPEVAQAPANPAPVADNNVPAPPTAQEPASSEPAPADPVQAAENADARIAALLNAGVKGPEEVRLADRATMWLPAGRVFIPAEPAQKLAQEAGLELRPGAQGLIAPAGDKLTWLAPVELLADGFIRTGEADALQAEKLLAAFQGGLQEVNANRAKSGQPPVSLSGWLAPPALNDKHRLSACVNVKTEGVAGGGDKFFNCEAWALGRQGAIKVSVAEGGEQAEKMKGEALALAETIVYDHGKAYEDIEFATDASAPYAAADLLTSDVSARTTTAPVAADGEEGGLSPVMLISKLWKIILFAVVAIGGVAAWFRRRNTQGDASRVVSRDAAHDGDAKDSPAQAESPPSLFARMLPTLHAKISGMNAARSSVPPQRPLDAGVDAISVRVAREPDRPAEKPAAGGLLGKLSALRARGKSGAAAPETNALAVAADEPASALKKLASKMRGAPEAPPAPVDVARVIRAARSLPGAAPEPAEAPRVHETTHMAPRSEIAPEPVEPARAVAAEPQPQAKPSSQSAPKLRAAARKSDADADDFGGLVEPGDEAASSAALHAREALRQASA